MLPEIFGFYEYRCLVSRPWTPTTLSVTTDYRRLVKVVRAAQYLLADDLLEYVAGVLEVPTLAPWEMSVKRMTDRLRSVIKVALFQKRTALNCFICGGSFCSDPPAVDVIARFPCCDGDVYPACLDQRLAGVLHCRCRPAILPDAARHFLLLSTLDGTDIIVNQHQLATAWCVQRFALSLHNTKRKK